MVVVDTGSSDRTALVARAAGARVLETAWNDDFSAARNRSLAEASGELALILDADEELVAGESALRQFREAALDEAAWGWQLRVRNISPPGEMLEYTDVWLTRLVRRHASVSYESPIHEQVTPSIVRAGKRVGRLEVTILHHGYARRDAQGASRAVRNAVALSKLARERPRDPYVHYQLGCAHQAGGNADAARLALDRARELDRGELPAEIRSGLALRLSQLALLRRDDREALGLARESLSLEPDNAVALQVLAVASVGAGDVAGGLAAFVRLRTRPNLRPAFVAQIDDAILALETLAAGRG
jgi:glycosyltransferase involved in cell wall biosynthesis